MCVFGKKNFKEDEEMCENMQDREGGEEKWEGGRFQKSEKQKPSHDGMDICEMVRRWVQLLPKM